MFLLVMLYTTFLLYLIEGLKLKPNVWSYFLASAPAVIFYIFIPSTQYFVGSDYPSYIFIYENPWVWGRYFEQGEYFFFYTLELLRFLDLDAQYLFFVFSLFHCVPIFLILFLIKRDYNHVRVWLLFLLFISVTNIYNNQLNGIRQYGAVVLMPLFVYALSKRKWVRSVFCTFAMSSMHLSSLISVFLYPLRYFIDAKPKFLCSIFFVSFFVYLFLPSIVPLLLDTFDIGYARYIGGKYFEASSVVTILTKVYYLPIYLMFYYYYIKVNDRRDDFFGSDFFKLTIVIFSFTFWIFIMSLKISILSRLQAYFVFFNIFPIYYVLNKVFRKNVYVFFILLLFVTFPYVAKVTFLAKNEFYYQSVIFN